MLILIKGAPATGKTTLADLLVSSLSLAPVAWPIPAEMLRQAQSAMGDWVDLAAYFASCRHLDMDRVITLLYLERQDQLPPPPRWRPGADRREMLAWREQMVGEVLRGRLLRPLFRLTCRLVDAAEHSILEGGALGTTLGDSVLTRLLRRRYAEVPTLRILLLRRPEYVALINGRSLRHEEVIAALERGPGGEIRIAPDIGWTSAGIPIAAPAGPQPAGRLS
jgi:hypothetical protein